MTKVLLVDDDPSVLAIAVKRLEAEAVQILTAADGAEALRIIRESRPDVVVLDVMMPKMTGRELLERIREVTETPVIMLTGLDEEEEKVRVLKGGPATTWSSASIVWPRTGSPGRRS